MEEGEELDKAFHPGVCDFLLKRDHEEGWLERALIILMNSIKGPLHVTSL